jgi:hypothetical protein
LGCTLGDFFANTSGHPDCGETVTLRCSSEAGARKERLVLPGEEKLSMNDVQNFLLHLHCPEYRVRQKISDS